MKLLSSPHSPFASRVRLAIHAYALPVDIVPADMWLVPGQQKSPHYLAINPIGKVPTLVLDDGSALPESDTIVEYLADAFPHTGLRPTGAAAIARARLLARVLELYVQTPAWPSLFPQLFAPARDPAVIDAACARIHDGLAHLEHFFTGDPYAVGDRITTADCALVPFFYFQTRILRALGKPDPTRDRPKLAAYLERVQRDPAVQRIHAEMREGLTVSRLGPLLAGTDDDPSPAA